MPRKKTLKGRMSGRKIREVAFYAGECCLEKKASEIVVLDLKKVVDVTDYFVIAQGFTDIHVRAVSQHLQEKLEEKYDLKPWHVEGFENGRWVLIDYVDFVVHVFQPETRQFYQLERLWADAGRFEIEDRTPEGKPAEF